LDSSYVCSRQFSGNLGQQFLQCSQIFGLIVSQNKVVTSQTTQAKVQGVIARKLLDAGANPDIINCEGRTAADIAADR
jgi:hypothetical protein